MDDSTSALPSVIPYLLYEDAAAALTWLTSAFGFVETLRVPDADGRVTHAELRAGDGVVMLGQPSEGYRSPNATGHRSQYVMVTVDDVDAHCARAQSVGAAIVSPPEDQPYGDRMYAVDDLEGQRWFFSQPIRATAPEEWGAVRA
jgi:uncharacterized glyoxalase superfamily protein PhnB